MLISYRRDLLIAHIQQISHQMIGLTNQLHVPILNSIVYHLHKMTGTLRSHLRFENGELDDRK